MVAESNRILVAMSGGVDSSVAAALLAADSRDEVVGVTLRFWPCESTSGAPSSCCGVDGVAAARDAAGVLGIPHYVIDCRDAFEERVLRPAWREYSLGRTPNPCVLCNAEIKLGLLREHARRLGAGRLATGHHARIEREEGSVRLCRGHDPGKDQSYFLFALTLDQLRATHLPLGRLTKAEVRDEARRLGLPNAERPESQDACFGGGERSFAEALRQRFGAPSVEGEIVNVDGRLLGRHQGIHHFTIGQRKGLGVGTGSRAYVYAIDADSGRVSVSNDSGDLLRKGLEAGALRWLVPPEPLLSAQVQIRYRHRAAPARIELLDQGGRALVLFEQPQRAVTPGQAAVFYRGEQVLGGGWIERSIR